MRIGTIQRDALRQGQKHQQDDDDGRTAHGRMKASPAKQKQPSHGRGKGRLRRRPSDRGRIPAAQSLRVGEVANGGLTAMFASNERRTANTAQRIAMRSQNGPVRAAARRAPRSRSRKRQYRAGRVSGGKEISGVRCSLPEIRFGTTSIYARKPFVIPALSRDPPFLDAVTPLVRHWLAKPRDWCNVPPANQTGGNRA